MELDRDDLDEVRKVGGLLMTKAHRGINCSVADSFKVSIEVSVKGSKNVDDEGDELCSIRRCIGGVFFNFARCAS